MMQDNSITLIYEAMGGKDDEIWREFFDLMMSSYKMEMRSPKEYNKKELKDFDSPVLLIASNKDIFFPANRVFKKAEKIFTGPIKQMKIDSKHLPSQEVMKDVCNAITEFLK